jgi:hypothetical protein
MATGEETLCIMPRENEIWGTLRRVASGNENGNLSHQAIFMLRGWLVKAGPFNFSFR